MSSPSPSIGPVLGHYQILEQIGAGGMGVVYRAHDERLDRDVALKVLPPGIITDEDARRHFRREALALAKLNHPNIATIHDFDTQNGVDFLVMEYVRGMTLADKLRAGALPEKEILTIGEQIAKALLRAHENGMVHRDLKPSNVMLTSSGDPKLLDFGISVLLKPGGTVDQTETATSLPKPIGTLPYMAPEQLRAEPVDGRCDIYAAGVVLYEMATGKRPFEEKVSTALIGNILTKPPVPLQELNPRASPALAAIIAKCLEKDPDNRYQSAKELDVDLRRALNPATSATVSAIHPRRPPIFALVATILIMTALTVLALNFGSVRNRFRGRTTPVRIDSLAVLPLENMSNDPSQEYFADGMTEELTTKLAQISALRVISRTSVMQYKRSRKALPEIARELQVDAVVEGSVMRWGDQVRITAQLIEAPSDKHLWAKDYDRQVNDILRLQDEVAEAIANEVSVKLTPQEHARLSSSRSVNSEAYQAYLKGRYYWNQGTEKQLPDARNYFEQAVKLDPNYAPAYVGLADFYWATEALPPQVAIPKAKDYALKALALDDSLPDAHNTLAIINFYGDWDWAGAEREFKRAIALKASFAEAHRMYSLFLSNMGRHAEALSEIRTAQELDPLTGITVVGPGWTYYYARQYDRAIEQCGKALQRDDSSDSARDCIGTAYLGKGSYEQGLAEFQKLGGASQDEPRLLTSLARSYALTGNKKEAQRLIRQMNAISKRQYVPPYLLAIAYGAEGEKNQAFSSLEKAYRQHDSFLVRLKVDEAMDPLRSDPRFENLLRRMGFSS